MRWRAFVLLVTARLVAPTSASALEPSVAECLTASEDGQRERDEGHYVQARESFATCSNSVCPEVVQRDCVSWRLELDESTPSLVFVVRDAKDVDLGDVVVRMDGAVLASRLDGKPILVDPGEHVFSFEAEGHVVERRAIVHVGEKNRVLRVAIEEPRRAPPPGDRVPLGSLVLGGVAVASIGSAAILWWTATSDLHSIESRPCAETRTCDPDDVHSVRTRLVVGDVLAGVGIAALGGAALLWLLRDRSVAVSLAPSAVRVSGTF